MEGITRRYPGVTALDSVDLSLDAGSVHAPVGKKGAGKSTQRGTAPAAEMPDGEIIQSWWGRDVAYARQPSAATTAAGPPAHRL